MTTASQSRASLASLAPLLLPGLGLAALLGAVRALPGDSASLLRLLVAFVAAAVAAFYRPAGVGLGIGTCALPLARSLLGWGGAIVVAAAAGAAMAL
ncbi:MAG TPA: hypothetical protein VFS60_07775, partial [Thermoanaerobaculia bacterium]|nr:hypothetical protein [Thermoanaerobaculia bacterium]